MVRHDTITKEVLDAERLTDIEVALYLLRLMDDSSESQDVKGPSHNRDIIFEMAENAVQTMANPFAKKLLADRMTELTVS